MRRRDFLKNSALLVAATTVTEYAGATGKTAAASVEARTSAADDGKLITSAPMLQNYAETSMGVAFSVSDMANGFVQYSEHPDMRDAVTVKCGGYRVTDMNDKVMLVRLTGLKPATKYYYKIGADRISYKGGYAMKRLGTEVDERVYSFTTAGKGAKGHFCVINDTHSIWKPFGLAIEKMAALGPSCVVWNGDTCNMASTIDEQIKTFLCPEIERSDYASEIPYIFCPGNHDFRGMANRHLEKVWMFRQPEERSSRDWDLGRNFAVRMGDIAMIGLDTAEDKVDENPLFAGLFASEAYREAQVAWLEDALQRPEIADAPYLVAFCHIPLFDADPRCNPGDVHPNDTDPRYSTDFACWQRTCARLWTPALEKAGCQLIITAHQHKYRYDAPTKERPWAQIVGGGPEINRKNKEGKLMPSYFPTVIEGEVVKGKLVVSVHHLVKDEVVGKFTFKPRKR